MLMFSIQLEVLKENFCHNVFVVVPNIAIMRQQQFSIFESWQQSFFLYDNAFIIFRNGRANSSTEFLRYGSLKKIFSELSWI